MIRHFTTLTVLTLLAGCAIQPDTSSKTTVDPARNPELITPDLYADTASGKPDAVRYSRYTLVNTMPAEGQRDLMSQIIDVTMPSNMNPNVRDAMEYVTARSGYQLCPAGSGYVGILYSRPLPAAQYKLGPMSLRNTLQVLAGPAWQVKVDEVSRNVCFNLRPGYQPPAPVQAAQALAKAPPVSTPTPVTGADDSGAVAIAVPAAAPLVADTKVVATAPSVPSTPVDKAKEGSNITPVIASKNVAVTESIATGSAAPAPSKPSLSGNQTTATPSVPLSAVTVATPVFPSSPPGARPPSNWTVTVADKNIRLTLRKWADKAGWTFGDEHWVSPVDIPISANATFNGDFKAAAQGLVGTTELSDTPLQPCFYTNNVIRVVGYNMTCDPASAR
ncbi:TcpQ domain-containing protein [Pseudomonas sp. 21LCFQ02]|uniref:PFGI-1 class ICE element type IV pilus protein PilL2 n=1 Tax=Pseudomonas sp. 21LCFQ02 TaxID=2957505 RepID=UPI00209AA5DB|nr:TcpQ domain-containing protein [Pseudomonas sp. 21LCFQ02]MCO8166172.1 TcpQ domain-containing protein [Pseudomonas sp. 21LCFQ02]